MEDSKVIELSKASLKKAIQIYPVVKVDCADGRSKYDVNMVLRMPYARGYQDGINDTIAKVYEYLCENIHLRQDEKEELLQGFRRYMTNDK